MQFANNFPRHEFLHSSTALKHGIKNEPETVEVEANLVWLSHNLQHIRDYLSKKLGRDIPIIVSSAYRAKALNDLLEGSSKTSAHMEGLAADLVPAKSSGLTVQELFDEIRAIPDLLFDQLIIEKANGKEWVHFGLRRPGNYQVRRMVFKL